jgi:hypothetical protein
VASEVRTLISLSYTMAGPTITMALNGAWSLPQQLFAKENPTPF